MSNLKPHRFPQQSAIAKYLAELAADGATTTYADLAKKFGFDPAGLMDYRHDIYQILQSIQMFDMDADRPSRTVVVNGLRTDMPGNGYFRLYEIRIDEDRKAIAKLHRAIAMRYYCQFLCCDHCYLDLPEMPRPVSRNLVYLPHHATDIVNIGAGRLLN